MATRRDPAAGWVDPDEFDRATAAAAAADASSDASSDSLVTATFTDPHSTTPDGDAPGPLTLPPPDVGNAGDVSDESAPTIAEMLAAAAGIDPDQTFDETAFGGGAKPGAGSGSVDDEIRLGPDLLPDRIGDPDGNPIDSTPSLESIIEDAFDDAGDVDAGGPDDEPLDDLLDGVDDPTDPFD